MTVIAAVLLTDRKPVFPVALEYLVNEPLIDKLYINIETTKGLFWDDTLDYIDASHKPYDFDLWDVRSSWAQKPAFDQDPKRFMPIATGRNMALDWAIVQNMQSPVDHLLFVDSDVRPHAGGLQYLLDLKKPLVGGLVPGRGAHSHVHYVFGFHDQEGPIIRCAHGTSGYLLIERGLFEVQRFRVGKSLVNGEFLCDDPCYSSDALMLGRADYWYIDTRAEADHVDDPLHPLTLETAINDYNNP